MKLSKLLLIIAVIILIFYMVSSCRSKAQAKDRFGADDQNNALAALSDLDRGMLQDRIEEVDNDYLGQNAEAIYLAKVPGSVGIAADDKENMTFFHPLENGTWPPGLYSKMYNWQPGFITSGWSYWMRPGISYDRWPRSRWVKSNNSYYYINNGGIRDRPADFNKGS